MRPGEGKNLPASKDAAGLRPAPLGRPVGPTAPCARRGFGHWGREGDAGHPRLLELREPGLCLIPHILPMRRYGTERLRSRPGSHSSQGAELGLMAGGTGGHGDSALDAVFELKRK